MCICLKLIVRLRSMTIPCIYIINTEMIRCASSCDDLRQTTCADLINYFVMLLWRLEHVLMQFANVIFCTGMYSVCGVRPIICGYI